MPASNASTMNRECSLVFIIKRFIDAARVVWFHASSGRSQAEVPLLLCRIEQGRVVEYAEHVESVRHDGRPKPRRRGDVRGCGQDEKGVGDAPDTAEIKIGARNERDAKPQAV